MTSSRWGSWPGESINHVSGRRAIGAWILTDGVVQAREQGGHLKRSHTKVCSLGVPNALGQLLIGTVVIALHTVLKELEDEVDNPDSVFNRTGAVKRQELGLLGENCQSVLLSLNKLLIKHGSLGTDSKRTWDRIKFAAGNLQDIRNDLMVHKSYLTLYLTTLNTGSLGRIEKKLDELIADVRAGRRAETVLTLAEDDNESEVQWNLWKKEMAEEGFSKVEIEGHKDWIKAALLQRIQNGKQPPATTSDLRIASQGEFSSPYSGGTSPLSGRRRQILASQPAAGDLHDQYARKSFDLAEELYDSDNSCLPTDSISQVNALVSARPKQLPSLRGDEGDVFLQGTEHLDDTGDSCHLAEIASLGERAQSSWPQTHQSLAHSRSAGYVFEGGCFGGLQDGQRIRQSTTSQPIEASPQPDLGLRNLDRINSTAGALWPSPLQLSRQEAVTDASPSLQDPIVGAAVAVQEPPTVLHRGFDITSVSVPNFPTSPGSQMGPSNDNLELASPYSSPQSPRNAFQRLSINTNGDLESTSASTTRFSQLSSRSRTTISSGSSDTLLRTGSTAKRAAANHEFIQAAISAEKDDLKNLSSWSRLPHVRSLLDPDTINTALIELSMNPKKEKRRVGAVEILLKECDPYLDCRDSKHQRTPLIWAVLNGHESIIHLLLAKNARLDGRDGKVLRTPLAWAAANGAWRATELLLKHPQSQQFLNAKDKSGRTALDLAEAGKYLKTKDMLLRHGAQPGINSDSPLPLFVELEG